MNKWVSVAAVGVALALAGCGKSDDKAADGKPAATAAADLVPGEYETKIEVTKFEVAGMPPAVLKPPPA